MIADTGEFTKRNLEKAKYEPNPLEDGSLAKWDVLAFDISRLTIEAVKPFGLGNKDALRWKNMWTLGLALWMFDRERQPLIDWLNAKFSKEPDDRTGQHRRAQRGPCLWRDRRDGRAVHSSTTSPPRPPSPASTARSPAPKRWRWAWSRAASSRA